MSLSSTGVSTRIQPNFDDINAILEAFHRSPANDGRWTNSARRAGKRFIDVIGSGLALLLLCPIMLAVAVLVRCTSRGPILFRQSRLSKGGKPFCIYKFRTMSVDAEERLVDLEHLNESDGGVLFKMKCDPRVTAVGRILRRTSLDELPQFYNIFRGDMSLVGPRPLQLRDCALMAEADPEGFARRLEVLPGLTGPWQVSSRSEVGFAHMLRMDLEYIDRWSLGNDFSLLMKTFFSVIVGRGAY